VLVWWRIFDGGGSFGESKGKVEALEFVVVSMEREEEEEVEVGVVVVVVVEMKEEMEMVKARVWLLVKRNEKGNKNVKEKDL